MSQLCTIKQNIIDTDPSVNDARNTSVYIFITYAARADFPRKYGNFPSAISSLIFADRQTVTVGLDMLPSQVTSRPTSSQYCVRKQL